ncbi:bifunctional diguanylate cyclase/phosphodiesterase [Notoacmeibacter sp. MSK16QG-6]|uniref:putative bifunctional diguanylate cyclase/phosphodiesterase n=1 Tax=Notoacmeibacter sp. MSK16QG-6 TaxID=2957982 RepID=UPI0020A180EF|nr:EAL domain-containing protein [Notoacmeibacter sp. MSK16QG-6]MCP1198945.1 EAL domain-containing protein [Notoacmeibacter sp. MSK16QG-6]
MRPEARTDCSDTADSLSTDSLTGLGNRPRFFKKLATMIDAHAADPVPFSVTLFNIDGFKPINDLFGRGAGDTILAQIALRLRNALDDEAVVCRLGGDEFAILHPSIFTEQALRGQAELLLELVSAPYDIGNRSVRVSCSVGGAVYENAADDWESFFEKAESALYHAKRQGCGALVVHTSSMEEAMRRRTQIEQALRRAVSAGEIEPFFQPIVDLRTGEPLGFECLARWTDPDFGAVPPSVFIPLAEERGIIEPLTQLLLKKACMAAREWPRHTFLSFNLSPTQMADSQTVRLVLSTIVETRFDPRRLEIEITETGVMSDPACAKDIVSQLRNVGIHISLDDFGTGQSSLGRLRNFHFDKLKIDRSFIATILEDLPSEHIVKAILALCEGLKIAVIAEGIEAREQADKLIELGCHVGQGYYFGTPADAATTLSLLESAEGSTCRLPRDELVTRLAS